jgi:FAD synthase
VPGDGVYAVTVVLQESSNISETLTTHSSLLTGMMYIGSRPVVNGKRRVIEVNIFNFNEDIYSHNIQVTVKKFIRGDMHFDGLEALKNQLAIDEKTTKEALKK